MDVGSDHVGSEFLAYALSESRGVGKVGIRVRGIEVHGTATVEKGGVTLFGDFSTIAHRKRGFQWSQDTSRNVTTKSHRSRAGYHQEDRRGEERPQRPIQPGSLQHETLDISTSCRASWVLVESSEHSAVARAPWSERRRWPSWIISVDQLRFPCVGFPL